jgi:hypothetical protein
MKSPSLTIGLTVVLVSVLFTVSKLGLVSYFLAFTFVTFAILYVANSHLMAVAFLIFLPTNDIFPKEDFLFSFLGLKQILSLFVILYFFKNLRKIKNQHHILRSNKKYNRILGSLDAVLLILVLYFNYMYFKNAFFGIHGYTFQSAILKSVNMTLQLAACFCAMRVALGTLTVGQVNQAMLSSVTLMLIFSAFSPLLPLLGFRSLGTEKSEFEQIGFERFSGIVADGDSNTLSVYLTLAFGMCLLFYIYYRKNLFIALSIPHVFLIGIAGSRTGIIALFVMLLLFFTLVKNQNSAQAKFHIILFLPVIALVSIPYFELLVNRFDLINEQFDLNSTSNRIGKWGLYLAFLWQHKIYFLTGTQSELLISWDAQYYSAHNAFITITYHSGLILSLALLYFFGMLFWFSFKYRMYELLMLVVPSFILINTVSDLGIIYSMLFFSIILIRNRFFFEYWNSRVCKDNSDRVKREIIAV